MTRIDTTCSSIIISVMKNSRPATPGPSTLPASMHIEPWLDPVVDRHGFDARSPYVETFWLGILGPSTTLLIRLLAAGFYRSPNGFDLDTGDTARMLGLGSPSSRHAPFVRTVARCVAFGVARQQSDHDGAVTLAVRRCLPPLPRRHLERLPAELQRRHEQWLREARTKTRGDTGDPIASLRAETLELALALSAIDNSPAHVEALLMKAGVHPALASATIKALDSSEAP